MTSELNMEIAGVTVHSTSDGTVLECHAPIGVGAGKRACHAHGEHLFGPLSPLPENCRVEGRAVVGVD